MSLETVPPRPGGTLGLLAAAAGAGAPGGIDSPRAVQYLGFMRAIVMITTVGTDIPTRSRNTCAREPRGR